MTALEAEALEAAVGLLGVAAVSVTGSVCRSANLFLWRRENAESEPGDKRKEETSFDKFTKCLSKGDKCVEEL